MRLLFVVVFIYLDIKLLLDDDVFHSFLPHHLFPPKPWGQRDDMAGGLAKLHGGDHLSLCKGHHDDDL